MFKKCLRLRSVIVATYQPDHEYDVNKCEQKRTIDLCRIVRLETDDPINSCTIVIAAPMKRIPVRERSVVARRTARRGRHCEMRQSVQNYRHLLRRRDQRKNSPRSLMRSARSLL